MESRPASLPPVRTPSRYGRSLPRKRRFGGLDAVAARLLGPVEGVVGLRDEGFDVSRVGKRRDAETRGDGDGTTVERPDLAGGDRRPRPLGEGDAAARVRPGKDQRELLP